MNHKKIIQLLTIITIMWSFVFIAQAVSKEQNDVLFILSLYEHHQYNMAKKQISVFLQEFPSSSQISDLQFVRANIAFYEMQFSIADSLYDQLINENINSDMLSEIFINKSFIVYKQKQPLAALKLLNKAEKITIDQDDKYQIAYYKGLFYLELNDTGSANKAFINALNIHKGDPDATFGLMKTYLMLYMYDEAKLLINSLMAIDQDKLKHLPTILYWLDYLISVEKYDEVINFVNEYRLKTDKLDDSVFIREAKVHYLLGDFETASKIINSCTIYPAYCSFIKGLILVSTGKSTEADSIFAGLAKGNIDEKGDFTEEIKVKSWLERVKILFDENKQAAISTVQDYLKNNIPSEQYTDILYTYSSLLFKAKSYQEAINNLLIIKQLELSPDMQHNVLIMLADIWFAAKIPENAQLAYLNYLNLYPKGRFVNHSRYNLALILFEKRDFDAAIEQINIILMECRDEAIITRAKYLSAEISFYKSDYRKALALYSQSDNGLFARSTIDYKVAQCYYYLEDYNTALGYIEKIVPDSTNAFPVYLLYGNIRFNLNQYEPALNLYYQAMGQARSDSDTREAKSYTALALYRLRRFTEASQLYLQLADGLESPQSYLIMAAKASYHSGDYLQALNLFNQFLEEYPDSDYTNNVLANLGSIHYNLSEYSEATNIWLQLIKRYQSYKYFENDDQVILASVFSGLLWSLKQNPNEKALEELNDMIDSFASEYIKFELQYLLLKVYYGNEQWSDILQMADNLRTEFPQKENNEIRRFVAASLAGLSKISEADSVYRSIFSLEPTADVLNEWAEMELKVGDKSEAVEKLRRAFDLEKTEKRFANLISAAYATDSDSLAAYWFYGIAVLDSIPDQSRLLWLKWNFQKGNWSLAKTLAESLLLNPDYQIRAQAQLLFAECFWWQQDYENAITELYRTVYLYSESPEIVLEAKSYIVRSYLNTDQLNEALPIYTEIRDALNPSTRQEIDDMITRKQESKQ